MKVSTITIAKIRRDGGTQPRAEIREGTIRDYAESMERGDKLPPVVVFYDGTDYWLADGFHRVYAAEALGREKIGAEVEQGTQRDAVLHSVGVNATHGDRRTNRDKRCAVEKLLKDPEWSQWSDREIARRCRVSHDFVNRLRPSLSSDDSEKPRSYRTKHGTTAKMRTENIGKAKGDPKPQDVGEERDPGPSRSEVNRRNALAFQVIRSLEYLASMDESPEEWISELPVHLRPLVEKSLDPAFAWISELKTHWS